MSKLIENIYLVSSELKATILDDIDKGIERSLDDVDALTTAAFRKIAKQRKVTESTIRDACTRRIDMNTKEFYDALRELIKDNSNTQLINRMQHHAIDDDDDWTIDTKMKKLF